MVPFLALQGRFWQDAGLGKVGRGAAAGGSSPAEPFEPRGPPTRYPVRKLLLSSIAVAAFGLAILVGVSQRPGPLGLVDGALRACAGSACVNSQIGPPEERIEPLFVAPMGAGTQDSAEAVQAAVAEAWRALQYLLVHEGRGRILKIEGPWMAAQWRAKWLFVLDDVEFLRLDSTGYIHVRSASRLGAFGMGTHRKAVGELRRRLEETLAQGIPGPSDPDGSQPTGP